MKYVEVVNSVLAPLHLLRYNLFTKAGLSYAKITNYCNQLSQTMNAVNKTEAYQSYCV